MGQEPVTKPPAFGPVLAALRPSLTGWAAGALFVVFTGLACVDSLPWNLVLLPLGVLFGHLAVRAADEWPRVGFPACVLGVSALIVASGLFRAGIGWSQQWESLRNSGALPDASGGGPVLGLALAVLLGGGFLAILFLHGEAIWRTLSSVKLAVVTLAAVGILSVIGTMVVQRFGAGSLPEPEQKFVEKFMKGQGAVPVNARFMLFPPDVSLTDAQKEKVRLTGQAFGENKQRQMQLGLEGMRERGAKAMAIEKHVEARRENLLALFERFDAMGFTNVFRTWWFNSLLVLLTFQLVAVLAKRYPWGWPQSGWVMTHVGVIVTLAGCVVSDGLLKDGSLGLAAGQVSDRFEEYTRLDARGEPTLSELGFRVKMLGTDQTFYHELQIAFPSVNAGDDILWTQEQLKEGRVLPLTDPTTGATYRVKVLEAHERALVETVMVPASSVGRTGGVPVLLLRYHLDDAAHEIAHPGATHGGGEHVVDGGYLFPDGYYSGRIPEYAVRYRVAETAEQARDLIAGRGLERQGTYGDLRVQVPGRTEPVLVPANPGEVVRSTAPDGTVWTFEVKKYHPSYWVGRQPPPGEDEEWPEKPALEIEVRQGRAAGDSVDESGSPPGTMLVYADHELQVQWEAMVRQNAGHGGDGHAAPVRFGGVASLCSYTYDFAPPVQTWIVEGPGVPRTLVLHRRGREPETADFSRPGAEKALGMKGLVLRLEEALPDGVPDLRVHPLAQETDAEYIESSLNTLRTGMPPRPTTAAARVEVVEKDAAGTRTRTEWLVAELKGVYRDRRFHSTDGNLVMLLAETQNALMFRSAVEVQSLDGRPIQVEGRPMRTVVRVNHPLHWGGYAFYQNSFIPPSAEGPAASVFRVKYDRGIPLVYSGFLVLTLGIILLLYVDPVLKKRRKEAAGKAAGEASNV